MAEFKNFTRDELAGEAGGDPWQINEALHAGHPASIDAAADQVHRAATTSGEIDEGFESARKDFHQAWVSDGSSPINESSEVQRIILSVGPHKDELRNVATQYEKIAAALATAQRSCDSVIGSLETQLHAADAAIDAAKSNTTLSPQAAQSAIAQAKAVAVSDTRTALSEAQGIRATYTSVLSAATTALKPTNAGLPTDLNSDVSDAISSGKLPDDPKKFRQVWDQLTPAEKDEFYNKDHFIGNHPGMPFVDRDHYNREHLPELTQQAQADVDRLRTEHPDWAAGQTPLGRGPNPVYSAWKKQWDSANRQVSGYQNVARSLNSPQGENPPMHRYLGLIDDKGHAAVSINNPDEATRVATFVPGTGQDLSRFDGSQQKSLSMYWAARDADPSLKPGDVSVTTWMGYDRPMDLPHAALTSYAHNGAQALDDFQSGLRASHDDAARGGPSLNTVIGHSYGSTLVGAASLDGHHLDANNFVAVGSPGVLTDRASNLDIDPNGHVYATRADNDIIGLVTGATLGPSPLGPDFGATVFDASPGKNASIFGWETPGWLGLPSIDAHSSYWNPGNPALDNMGRIIAGEPQDVTPPR